LIGLTHANQELAPGVLKPVDLLDVFLGKAFNFTVIAISFPSLDILELLLDGWNPRLPCLLLRAHLSVALLVVLQHVKGSAVLLELVDGVVETVDELVEVLLALFDEMLLDLGNQLAGTLFLVVTKRGVVKLDEETGLS
jgi:hypothetical protein